MSAAPAQKQGHDVQPAAIDTARLPEAVGAKLRSLGMAMLAIGVVLGAAGFFVDRERFLFSYLAGFTTIVNICVAALLFVVIQHLTKSVWSVAARRTMEQIASFLPVAAILFVPIALSAHTLWHHWMGPEAAHDHLLVHKKPYLNEGFFYIRAVFYFVLWGAVAWKFRADSLKQDETGDRKLTLGLRNLSPPMTLLVALTMTFAAFDWLMSLDPHWYSTVFGVYVFAGGTQAMFALLAIITVQLQVRGYFKRVSTVEHRHDIGKLTFGFTVFYAYIAFCQYFLIWYANIPEETIFYRHRWEENWQVVSLILIFTRFVIPFVLLLSRHTKRHPVGISLASGIILFSHWIDHYWMVLPTHDEHSAHFSWVNLAGLALPVGVFLFWLSIRLSREPLYPLKDPKLAATYKNVNL